jgi:hypothetical protein
MCATALRIASLEVSVFAEALSGPTARISGCRSRGPARPGWVLEQASGRANRVRVRLLDLVRVREVRAAAFQDFDVGRRLVPFAGLASFCFGFFVPIISYRVAYGW